MARKKATETEKPHVLTKKEAWMLLAASSDYMNSPDREIGGRDKADILAESALAKGYSNLSDSIASIHHSVRDFHKGNYKGMQYLLEGPAISEQVMRMRRGRISDCRRSLVWSVALHSSGRGENRGQNGRLGRVGQSPPEG